MRLFLVKYAAVTLACMALLTSAKKEKPMNVPYPQDVVDDMRCDVCHTAAKQAYARVLELHVASKRTRVPVNEEDVLVAIEDLCNPLASEGQWIRKFGVNTSYLTSAGAPAQPLFISVYTSRNYLKCKRTCKTASDACELVMDDEEMDQFSSYLLRLTTFKDAEAFAEKTCGVASFCKKRSGFSAKRYKEVLEVIALETPEEIDQKEMDMERLMDQMERRNNQRQDIYSREEIIKMLKSLIEGDMETASSIDPSLNRLTDEERRELQRLLREKKTHEGESGSGGDMDEVPAGGVDGHSGSSLSKDGDL
uniref:DUF3456 domain-containing protein n=1 Tax=Trypanosoma congolense (strain IL3000) TaxID=1068625 RepID=G0UXA0_TRYCI|nr:conserved hypothetical protein [Trypanosoma congolense IL3000]